MSHNRWQFPGHMEPVLPTARVETITLDQWNPSLPTPRPRRSLPAAILAGALFFVPVVAVQAAPTVDKWAPSLPPIVQKAKALPTAIQSGRTQFYVQVDIPIPIFAALQEPPAAAPRVSHGFTVIDPIALKLPEPPQIDKWGQPTEQPPRAAKRIVEAGLTVFDPRPLPNTAVPVMTSWEPRLVIPPRSRTPLVAVGLHVIDPAALLLLGPSDSGQVNQAIIYVGADFYGVTIKP
jgi:hypothetical protein